MKNLPFKRVSSDIAAKVSGREVPRAPKKSCETCAGARYVRASNLPPTHRLFGRRLPCPKCHLTPVKTRLAKSWPVTQTLADFGRTPFANRPEYPQIAVAWQAINAFKADLPDYRLLMIHGPSGVVAGRGGQTAERRDRSLFRYAAGCDPCRHRVPGR